MECPVCGKFLPRNQAWAAEHVNGCLDHHHSVIRSPAQPNRQTSICTFFGLEEAPKKVISPKASSKVPLQRLPWAVEGPTKAQKRIIGTNFVVDAFASGPIPSCDYYFLSHFHSDHYNGLKASFDWGRIVTSEVTGNLVSTILGVDEAYIRRVPLYTWTMVEGVEVMLIDAFHCPGSVMFIFCLSPPSKDEPPKYVLHTGDFRASEELINNPIWSQLGIPKFDIVYLDTTYCNPDYNFPPQTVTVANCVETVDRLLNKADRRLFSPIKRLVLVGAYLIGKEKIAVAIAKLLDCKIYCSPRKRLVFGCFQWPELQYRLTDDAAEAQVHIVSMSDIDSKSIGVVLDEFWPRYTHALAIRPTGWTFSATPRGNGGRSLEGLSFHTHTRRDALGQTIKRKDTIAILAAPYSEHSSFSELIQFLEAPWMRFDWVIPTVDNPLDLYLRRGDCDDPKRMLSVWAASKRPDKDTLC